jgi:hypothetical protein
MQHTTRPYRLGARLFFVFVIGPLYGVGLTLVRHNTSLPTWQSALVAWIIWAPWASMYIYLVIRRGSSRPNRQPGVE